VCIRVWDVDRVRDGVVMLVKFFVISLLTLVSRVFGFNTAVRARFAGCIYSFRRFKHFKHMEEFAFIGRSL